MIPRVHFCGGLGDVFMQMYQNPGYRFLQQHKDAADVVMKTSNPFSAELFLWHPNALNIRVSHTLIESRNYSAEDMWSSPVAPVDCRVEFFPKPGEIPELPEHYVVLAAGASVNWKAIPHEGIQMVAKVARQVGLPVVAVGRSYPDPIEGRRDEPEPPEGVINLIDKLSVPAVAVVVQKSLGAIASHSAVCMLSWLEEKPTLLLYSPDVLEKNLASGMAYQFGRGRPGNLDALVGAGIEAICAAWFTACSSFWMEKP